MLNRTSRSNTPSLVIAVLFAIGIVAYLVISRPPRIAELVGDCITVNVAASQEKSALFTDLAKRYGETRPTVNGKCVVIKVTAKASGAAEEALARGWDEQADGVRPDVWSPASTSWVVLLRQHRASRDSGSGLVPDDVPALLQSPLVIAMPRPMAEALGWPNKELGWADILTLARDPAGWGSRGHPEWSEFRLGKTNPNISTSGLHALIGTYFAATGRSTDLSDADLDDPRVIEFVKGVESSVVHYGETVSTFLRHLKAADERGAALSYVSAIAIEEKQVFDYNRGQGGARPSMPLAAIYPKEGTLVADHPYAVLNAPWVTDDKRAAAAGFLEFLRSPATQRTFIEAGFRDAQGRAGPDVTTAVGLLPEGARTIIKPPAPPVLERIQASWTEVRKRARVLFVLDVSGSMAGTKLDLMKSASIHALDQFADDDEVGLWVFSSQRQELAAILPIGPNRSALKAKIAGLVANGGTALYATVRQSVAHLRQHLDHSRINGVVFLTDGRNEHSDQDLDGLLRELRSEDEKRIVRVFTLGYGKDADQDTLKRIADESRAAFYDASNPATITKVFTDLVSNF